MVIAQGEQSKGKVDMEPGRSRLTAVSAAKCTKKRENGSFDCSY